MVAIVTGNGLGIRTGSSFVLGGRGQLGEAALGRGGDKIYVNAKTGNLHIKHLDATLMGVGSGVELTRAYNSLGLMNDDNGDNWQPGQFRVAGLVSGAVGTAGSVARRVDWDGSEVLYGWDAGKGCYVASEMAGARDTLTFDASTRQWRWKGGADGVTEVYDGGNGGRVLSRADLSGNTVSYAYNAAGYLGSVRTANGESIYLDYTGKLLTRLRSEAKSSDGAQAVRTIVRYQYDASGRLSRVGVDVSPDDDSVADGKEYWTTYAYDGASSRVNRTEQSDGTRLEISYVEMGGIYRVGSIRETVDGTARSTTFAYGADGKATEVVDNLGQKTTLAYDAQGRLTQVRTTGAGGVPDTVSYAYDARGNVTSATDALGRTVSYLYDNNGNLAVQRDQAGNTIRRSYGEANLLMSETTYLVPDPDGAGAGQPGKPLTVRYVYDKQSRLRFALSAEGRVSEYRYDGFGQRVTAIQYQARCYDVSTLPVDAVLSESQLQAWALAQPGNQTRRTDTAYDFRGNVARVTEYGAVRPDGVGIASAGSATVTTLYVYDQAGRLLERRSLSSASGQSERFVYDGLGRLQNATSATGALTLYQYDDAGRKTTVTLANGLARTSLFNQAGELVSLTESGAGVQTSVSRRFYDGLGRLRIVLDERKARSQVLYDEAGRKAAEINSEGAFTEYVYDRSGNLARTIHYATRLTTAQRAVLFDATSGKPIERKDGALLTIENASIRPAASAQDRVDYRFYDAAGRLYRTVDGAGSVVEYRYDGVSHLVATLAYARQIDMAAFAADPVVTRATTVADAADRLTRQFYDGDGKLTGQLDAEGYLTEYRYDAAGNRTHSIAYATAIGGAQRAAETLAGLKATASAMDIRQFFFYDARGNLTSAVDGEGYLTSYRYDETGRLAGKVEGGRVDPAQFTAPQTVPLTFQARGSVANGEWPALEVWVDGKKITTLTIDVIESANYTVNVPDVVPFATHEIALVFTNDLLTATEDRNVWVRNVKFGARSLEAGVDTSVFDQGVGAAAFDGLSVVATAVGGTKTISRGGAVRWAVDPAATLAAFAKMPANPRRTAYSYDADGRLLTTTRYLAGGATESDTVAYDAVGNKLAETVAGQTVRWRRDAQGRVVQELFGEGSAALAALGNGATQADQDAIWSAWATFYAYDIAGRRISATNANGIRTLYYYNNIGQLAYTVNGAGEHVGYLYDGLSRLIETRTYINRLDSAGLAALTGGAITTGFTDLIQAAGGKYTNNKITYGKQGAVEQTTDALAKATRFSYNAFGELAGTISPAVGGQSRQATRAYDRRGLLLVSTADAAEGGLKLSTRTVYDAFGRATQITLPNGAVRKQAYDRNGRVIAVTDALGQQTGMSYDAFGNVLTQTDRLGNITRYAYSAFERELKMTTPEGLVTTTTRNARGQTIAVQDPLGNRTEYSYDADGRLLTTRQAAGALDLVSSQRYDRAGQLTESIDPNGNKVALAYDAASRLLTRTVDPGGLALVTTYAYDSSGRVVRATDPGGMVTETTYDANGRSVKVVVDQGTGTLALTTAMSYDDAGNVVRIVEGSGSPAARTTVHVYDGVGRRIESAVDPTGLNLVTRYAYDAAGNVTARTDAAGNVARYVHDGEGRVIYVVDATGGVLRQEYDAEGRLATRSAYARRISLSGFGLTLSSTEVAGRVAPDTSADRVERWVYDKDGRLRYSIDGRGYVEQRIYDKGGNVVWHARYGSELVSPEVLTPATVAAAVTAQGLSALLTNRVTRYVFDAAGRQTFKITGGQVTEYRYDKAGSLLATVAYATRYATSDNPSDAAMRAWLATGSNSADARVSQSRYDAANRLKYEVDAAGYVTQYDRDEAGRTVRTVRYASAVKVSDGTTSASLAAALASQPPASAAVTESRYDRAGRLFESVDAGGVVTRFERDALGQATKTFEAFGTVDESVTLRRYDRAGRLYNETLGYGRPEASSTLYEYDALGRLTRRIDPLGHELSESNSNWALGERKAMGMVGADGNVLVATALSAQQKELLRSRHATSFQYDALGHVVMETDALGGTRRTEYNAFGNAVKVVDLLGNAGYFYYDRQGNNVLQVDPEGFVTATTYTVFGEVGTVTRHVNRVVGSVSAAVPPEMRTAPAETATTPYLLVASEQDATTSFVRDQFGRLTRSTDALGKYESFGYDGFGNRISYRNKLGCVTSYQYDARGLLIRETLPITSRNAAGVAVAVVNSYGYDARGNRTLVVEADGLPEQRKTTYQFDAMNREIKRTFGAVPLYSLSTHGETPATLSESRAYDARGNLIRVTAKDGGVTTSYYDAIGRKSAEISALGQLTQWSYNRSGDVTVVRTYGDPVAVPADRALPQPVNTANARATLYSYDANHRQIETRVKGITFGRRDPASGNYQKGVTDVVTRTQYDANGNAVLVTDANGGETYSFYNRSGELILTVDPERYGVAYMRDANGNALRETRFATQFGNPVTTQSDGAALIQQWTVAGADRITLYTYDKNGRVLSEGRQNVEYWTVGSNGALSGTNKGAAIIWYSYDGLGNVTGRTDGNASRSNWAYDAIGRRVKETLPLFDTEAATGVRMVTDYEYDGLGNVVREIRRGADNSSEADDQITLYAYGSLGRLARRVDPQGNVVRYGYDRAGNVNAVITERLDADGTKWLEETGIAYDLAGRETSRRMAVLNASANTWSTKPVTETRYNLYGEMTGQRVGGGNAAGAWQKVSEYDQMGRVWRTNAGAGVTKVYLYDAMGNATAEFESQTLDLNSLSLDQILASPQVMRTVVVYDKRNQILERITPQMNVSGTGATLQARNVNMVTGSFDNVTAKIGASQAGSTGSLRELNNLSDIAASSKPRVTTSFDVGYTMSENNVVQRAWVNSMRVTVPDRIKEFLGADKLTVRVSYRFMGSGWRSNPIFSDTPFSDSQNKPESTVSQIYTGGSAINIPLNWSSNGGGTTLLYEKLSLQYTIYFDVESNGVSDPGVMSFRSDNIKFIETANGPNNSRSTTYYPTDTPAVTGDRVSNLLQLHTSDNAQATDVYYRQKGATGSFAKLSKVSVNGHSYAQLNGLATGNYEILLVSTKPGGGFERFTRYDLSRDAGSQTNTLRKVSHGNNVRGTGYQLTATGGFVFNAGVLTCYDLRTAGGVKPAKVAIRYRPLGSSGAYSATTLAVPDINSGYSWNVSGLASGDYEVIFDLKNADNALLDTMRGTLTVGGSPNLVLNYVKSLPSSVVFSNLSTQTKSLEILYRRSGSTGAFSRQTLASSGSSSLAWDASALVPDNSLLYDYEIEYVARDQDGFVVNRGVGRMTLGATGQANSITIAGSTRPPVLAFTPPAGSTRLELYYRVADPDGTRDFTKVLLNALPSGAFKWDASLLDPARTYEYYYDAFSGASNLGRSTGTFKPDVRDASNGKNQSVQYVLEGLYEKGVTIHRKQTRNAYGEVISEVDGRGNTTQFVYNTQGALIRKVDARTSITNEAGVKQTVAPTTYYYVDRAAQTVGTRDANGYVNTRRLSYGMPEPVVIQQWNAGSLNESAPGGGTRLMRYDIFGSRVAEIDELGRRTDYRYDSNNRLIRVERPAQADGSRLVDQYQYDSLGNRIVTTDASGGRTRTYYDEIGRVIKQVSAAGRATQYSYAYDKIVLGAGGAQVGGWKITTTQADGRTLVDQQDIDGRTSWHSDLGGRKFVYNYNWAGLVSGQTSSNGQNIAFEYYANGLTKTVRDLAIKTVSSYEYDEDGNRTFEGYYDSGRNRVFQHAYIEYDALNRIKRIKDSGQSGDAPEKSRYTVDYEYDAVGNRRRMVATYRDTVAGRASVQNYWYRYDAQNRFVVTMGKLEGGKIVGGASGDGVELGYNAAGERKSAFYASDQRTERYEYDSNGRLTQVMLNGKLVSERTLDALGRVRVYQTWNTAGAWTSTTTRAWDADGAQTSEAVWHLNDKSQEVRSDATYVNNADGSVQSITTSTTVAGGSASTQTLNYTYEQWDSAKQKTIRLGTGWADSSSLFEYDVNGHLRSAVDVNGGRKFDYDTDSDGRVLNRQEYLGVTVKDGKVVSATSNRYRQYYYANGHRVGNAGTDESERADYVQELARITAAPESKLESYKRFKPVMSADFDENYQPITGNYPAVTPGSYTVRGGDTLRSVAQAVWGDAALWYVLADANGLSADEALKPNTTLVIPNKVTNIHNTAQTFKPYQAGQGVGDASPTMLDPPPPPQPKGGGGCGGIASVIAVVIAVVVVAVVTVYTSGTGTAPTMQALGGAGAGVTGSGAAAGGAVAGAAASAPLSLGASIGYGAAAGAAASALSQGVMILAGEQHGFNWKGVALGAVGGAISGGLAGAGVGSSLSPIGAGMLRGAIGSAATQGVALASGMQQRFDWRGVAASAIAGGIGAGIGEAAGAAKWNPLARQVSSGLGAGLASAGVRGDLSAQSLGYIAADLVGNTIGNQVAERLVEGMGREGGGGNALGSSLASANSSSAGMTAQEQMLAQSQGNVMSQGSLYGNADGPHYLDSAPTTGIFPGDVSPPQTQPVTSGASGSGYYWSDIGEPQTQAQRYAQTFGGQAINTSATGEVMLPQVTVRADRIEIEQPEDVFGGSFGRSTTYGPAVTGDIRATNPVTGFFTDTTVGKTWLGLSEGTLQLITAPLEAGRQAVLTAGDAIGHAVYGVGNALTGGNIGYQSSSALYQSLERQGALGTIGSVATGTVKGMLGSVDALYRRDLAGFAESVPGAVGLVSGVGALRAGRFDSALMNSGGDRLLGTMGPARLNNAAEYNSIVSDLRAKGVDISFREGQFAYGPAPSAGRPGNIVFDRDASISAIRHEYGHFLDDSALGFPGQRYYYENPSARLGSERRQYLQEIRTAREVGDQVARRQLVQDYLGEKNYLIDNYYVKPYGMR